MTNLTQVITGLIVEVQQNNLYTIIINGVEYSQVPSLNQAVYEVNNTVKVIIPQGQFTNIFILGKI
jgi:propanediol utilization protein